MTAHKHAALMLQYAQDAAETDKPWLRWECYNPSELGTWTVMEDHPVWSLSRKYRRKPRTMTYTVTIPEPMREAPDIDTRYFFPDLGYFEKFCEVTWDGDSYDHHRLKCGLCFATAEDAVAAAKAMIPFGGAHK